MAFDRQAAKAQLLRRTQESANKADDSGRFSNIFRKDQRYPIWACKEGTHTIDILPYVVGTQHPTRTYPDVHEGDLNYVLDVWVHRGIGVNEDSYVCPARNYNLPCPICEEIADLRRTIDPDAKADDPVDGETVKLIKAISPKRRVIYNIVCWDTQAEADKGVQIFETAHFFMEKHLATLAERPRGGGHITFSDPDDGQSIIFKREGTGINTSFIGHRFDPRPEPISDDLLDLVYPLDEIVVIPTYEELYEAYHGRAFDPNQSHERFTDEPEARPRTVRSPRPAADTAAPSTRATRSTTQATATEQESAPDARPRRAPATVAAAAPQPATRQPSTRQPSTRQPAAAASAPATTTASDEEVCPHGGRFGYDVDTFDVCNECQTWDACARKNASIGQSYDPSEGEAAPPPHSASTRRSEAAIPPRRPVQDARPAPARNRR